MKVVGSIFPGTVDPLTRLAAPSPIRWARDDAKRGIRKFTAHEDVRPTGRVPVATGSVPFWDRAVLFQGVRHARRAEREGLRVLPHHLNTLPDRLRTCRDHLRTIPDRLRAMRLGLAGIRECLRTVPAGLSEVHPRLKRRPVRVEAQRLRIEPKPSQFSPEATHFVEL